MCVNNQSLSGHYYAEGQFTPERTIPVSIDSFIALFLYVSFNFVINKGARSGKMFTESYINEKCTFIIKTTFW